MNIIEQLEQEEIARLGKTVPEFAPGDTVIVNVNVVEDRVAGGEFGDRGRCDRKAQSRAELIFRRAQDLERRGRREIGRAHV